MILILTLGIFVLTLLLVLLGKTMSFDEAFSAFVIQRRNNAMTAVMKFFTEIGKGKPVLAVCLLLIVFPDTRGTIASPVGMTLLLAGVSVTVLKKLVARPRPEGNRLVEETDHSFPSSHAAMSAALYGSIAVNIRLVYPSAVVLAAFLCVAMAFLIGFSRIYLGIHYPTDVIGGWSLGTFACVLMVLVL